MDRSSIEFRLDGSFEQSTQLVELWHGVVRRIDLMRATGTYSLLAGAVSLRGTLYPDGRVWRPEVPE